MPPGPFIVLSEVDSTNNYAMAKLHTLQIEAGSCFQAVEQTAGKGQRGRKWMAGKGSNITMSVCLRPAHTGFPFLLSASMALGCYKFIKECGVHNVSVKWPNDVYISDRKAAGILIENSVRGRTWEWAVVGIGVNVNQTDFGELGDRATSLKKALGAAPGSPILDVTGLARRLHQHLLAMREGMEHQSAEEIMQQYNAVLYRRHQTVRLKKDSAVFTTTIDHVSAYGELVTRDTLERRFSVGEAEFISATV